MRIAFVADARSPITRSWIKYFIERDHEVHVITTYRCEAWPNAAFYEAPIGPGPMAVSATAQLAGQTETRKKGQALPAARTSLFSSAAFATYKWVLPLDLGRSVRAIRNLIFRIQPSLVHALRIPFEGIVAAKAVPDNVPLMISTWGNDLTLWASSNPLIARQTRFALKRADALLSDCTRDLRLAVDSFGFDETKPRAMYPGAGGVQPNIFCSGSVSPDALQGLEVPDRAEVILNPRGMRAYVANENFFQAIRTVLRTHPRVVVLCPGMAGNALAERWVNRLSLEANVRLLPSVSAERMAELFRAAAVTVSPSLHDGTPNSLLEAMACGSFPVVGDLESIREWIVDRENGLLCDPSSPSSIADRIVRALEDGALRDNACTRNRSIINERAEYRKVMPEAERFYHRVLTEASATGI